MPPAVSSPQFVEQSYVGFRDCMAAILFSNVNIVIVILEIQHCAHGRERQRHSPVAGDTHLRPCIC